MKLVKYIRKQLNEMLDTTQRRIEEETIAGDEDMSKSYLVGYKHGLVAAKSALRDAEIERARKRHKRAHEIEVIMRESRQ